MRKFHIAKEINVFAQSYERNTFNAHQPTLVFEYEGVRVTGKFLRFIREEGEDIVTEVISFGTTYFLSGKWWQPDVITEGYKMISFGRKPE